MSCKTTCSYLNLLISQNICIWIYTMDRAYTGSWWKSSRIPNFLCYIVSYCQLYSSYKYRFNTIMCNLMFQVEINNTLYTELFFFKQ